MLLREWQADSDFDQTSGMLYYFVCLNVMPKLEEALWGLQRQARAY